MLAHRERRRFTPEEYLALEERSESKSEFYEGEIYAMSGASIAHNQLVRNLTSLLATRLRGGECQLFVADLRLHVAAHNLFTYPDLFAVCGPLSRLNERNDTLTDATFVVEVLSPSTQSYDRGQKFLFYQDLPSFKEYLLVSQDRRTVELHTLQREGQWLSTRMSQGKVELQSLDVTLEIDDIYLDVDLTDGL